MGQLEVLVQEAAAVPHQDLFRRQVETVVISILQIMSNMKRMQGRAVLCVAGFLHDDAGDPGAARPHRLHLRPRHHGHRRHQSRHVSSHSSSVGDSRTLLHCNDEYFQNHTS